MFEYLSTDLKKYMDRNGKGPSNPMHPDVIKVPHQTNPDHPSAGATCACLMLAAGCWPHEA